MKFIPKAINSYELYIFDFDGTIIDSSTLMKDSLKYCYQKAGQEVNPPYQAFFSMMGESLENIFNRLGLPSYWVNDYREFATQNIHRITLFEELKDVLKILRERNKKLALFTGKDRMRTLKLLHKFELEELFDEVITPDELQNPKPHPEGINLLTSRLNVSPDQTLMIGDSLFDMQSASEAGVDKLFVLWGTGKQNEIAECSPTFVLQTPRQLREVISGKGAILNA